MLFLTALKAFAMLHTSCQGLPLAGDTQASFSCNVAITVTLQRAGLLLALAHIHLTSGASPVQGFIIIIIIIMLPDQAIASTPSAPRPLWSGRSAGVDKMVVKSGCPV
jgi:hypothetical protein